MDRPSSVMQEASPAALDFPAEQIRAMTEQVQAANASEQAAAAKREAHVQEARQRGELPPLPAGPDAAPAPHVEPLRFITASQIKDLPPVAWRVKNVFPAQGVAAIYGPPASGKSFLALDMAAAIASGRDWFGHKTAAAPVFYVYLEGSGALKNRIAAWEHERERAFPDGVTFYLGAFNLFESMDSLVTTIPHGAVVVVDTLAASAPGFDENSGADMSRAIEALSRVAREKNGLALVVHHSGKDAARGLRGHSSLLGALDAAICVDRSGASSVRRWTLAKSKDAEDGISFQFSLHRVELGTDADGDTVSSCVVRRVEGEQRETVRLSRTLQYGLDSLKEVLAEEGESRVHVDAWRTAFYRNHWGDNTHAKKTAFLRARSDLTRAGLVCVHDDEYFLPSQAEETATGTTGTERHKTGTCAARHTIVEDGTDGTIRHTPPLGGVPCAASVPPRDAREKKKDYVGGLCAAPVPYEEGER